MPNPPTAPTHYNSGRGKGIQDYSEGYRVIWMQPSGGSTAPRRLLSRRERDHVTRMLEMLIGAPGFTGRAPGGPSRWSTERTGEWQPLKTKLVVEVQYDQFSSDRFRHGTKLLRWRPDKAPRQCTLAQVEQESAQALALLDPRARKKAATLRRSA